MKTDYQQQAEQLLKDTGATLEAKFLYHGLYWDDDKDNRDVYEIASGRVGDKPTAYDVLACITKSDPGTFTDFCADFGYDTDSRKAEKTYFAVQEEWKNCERLFGDVLEQLQEIS